MKFIFSLITILFLAEGCKTAEKSVSNAQELQQKTMEQQTLSGTYMISEIDNKSDFKQELTITFDESAGTVSGFCGCNTFFGKYTVSENEIEFKNIFSSKKLCQEAQNNTERQFLEALNKTNSFKIEGSAIQLYNSGEQLLKANKQVASRPDKGDTSMNNQTLITYQAQSRGMFEYIQVSKSEVKMSSDMNLKNIDTRPIKTEDWRALKKMLENISVESLDQLKAQTDKRMYDGAAHATLSVIRGDVETMTPSFDHGAPPKEIENLVNKVLSIKETATKQ